ncbi:MAG: hypothetical protein ACPHLK_07295 [Gammaproteobacteria bacterium]|jgi:hypothetical protein
MKSLIKTILISSFSFSTVFFMPLANTMEDRDEVHSSYTLKSDGVMPTVANPTASGSTTKNSFGSNGSNGSNSKNSSAKSTSSRSSTTVTTKQKYTDNSVPMIIGGKSENGVAKQVALPIPE